MLSAARANYHFTTVTGNVFNICFHSNGKKGGAGIRSISMIPPALFALLSFFKLWDGCCVRICKWSLCHQLHCSLLFLCSAANGSISTSNEHWTEALHWYSAELLYFSPSLPPPPFPKKKRKIEMLISSDD